MTRCKYIEETISLSNGYGILNVHLNKLNRSLLSFFILQKNDTTQGLNTITTGEGTSEKNKPTPSRETVETGENKSNGIVARDIIKPNNRND